MAMDTNDNAEKEKSSSHFMEMDEFDPQTNSNNVEDRKNQRILGQQQTGQQQHTGPQHTGPPQQMGSQQQIETQQTGPPQEIKPKPMELQPNGRVWMAAPTLPENVLCPPGLECFGMLSQLVVHQRTELITMLTGIKQGITYDIFNRWDQYVFRAKEESKSCHRDCCGPIRSFQMKFLDVYDREVIHFNRPCACINLCCLSVLTVEAPVGVPIGCIRQKPGCVKMTFHVMCPVDTHVATIEAPHCCKCCCRSDIPYPIFDLNGKQIGEITRHITMKAYITDADNFTIKFDEDLSVWLKACLMGALFLVSIMFYERHEDPRERKEEIQLYGHKGGFTAERMTPRNDNPYHPFLFL